MTKVRSGLGTLVRAHRCAWHHAPCACGARCSCQPSSDAHSDPETRPLAELATITAENVRLRSELAVLPRRLIRARLGSGSARQGRRGPPPPKMLRRAAAMGAYSARWSRRARVARTRPTRRARCACASRSWNGSSRPPTRRRARCARACCSYRGGAAHRAPRRLRRASRSSRRLRSGSTAAKPSLPMPQKAGRTSLMPNLLRPSDNTFTFTYGDVTMFFAGLEGLLGSPSSEVTCPR